MKIRSNMDRVWSLAGIRFEPGMVITFDILKCNDLRQVKAVVEDIRTGKIDICYRQLIKEKISGKFWVHIGMVKIPFKPKDKYLQKLTTTDGKKYIEVK